MSARTSSSSSTNNTTSEPRSEAAEASNGRSLMSVSLHLRCKASVPGLGGLSRSLGRSGRCGARRVGSRAGGTFEQARIRGLLHHVFPRDLALHEELAQRLIEALHPVLGTGLDDRENLGRLVLPDEVAQRRDSDQHLDRGHPPLAVLGG